MTESLPSTEAALIAFNQAVAKLDEAQQAFVNAMKMVSEHAADPNAHKIILDRIEELAQSEAIVTKTFVKETVATALSEHGALSIAEAHPNIADAIELLKRDIAKVNVRVDDIVGIVPSPKTDLQLELQAVEDKYYPILRKLEELAAEALKMNNTTLYEKTRVDIDTELTKKRNEIMLVLEKYKNA